MSGRAGLHLREGRTSSPGGRSWARRCNSGRPEVGRRWPHLRILKSGPEFKPAVRMSSPVSGLHFRVRRKWAEYLAEPESRNWVAHLDFQLARTCRLALALVCALHGRLHGQFSVQPVATTDFAASAARAAARVRGMEDRHDAIGNHCSDPRLYPGLLLLLRDHVQVLRHCDRWIDTPRAEESILEPAAQGVTSIHYGSGSSGGSRP